MSYCTMCDAVIDQLAMIVLDPVWREKIIEIYIVVSKLFKKLFCSHTNSQYCT